MIRILFCAASAAGVWPIAGHQVPLQEARVLDELWTKALREMGALRQHEAKSGWLRKRVGQGLNDAPGL